MTRRSRVRYFTRGKNRFNSDRSPAKLRFYQQSYDKYLALAKEMLGEGDRILAERHFQCADHFYRMIQELTPLEENLQSNNDDGNNDDNLEDTPSNENSDNPPFQEEEYIV